MAVVRGDEVTPAMADDPPPFLRDVICMVVREVLSTTGHAVGGRDSGQETRRRTRDGEGADRRRGVRHRRETERSARPEQRGRPGRPPSTRL